MIEFITGLTRQAGFGEALALGAGLAWAAATILFRISGRKVSPLGLNFFKNSFSLVLVALIMVILGKPLFPAAPIKDYALLALSGILGIAAADTLFFRCLNLMGASFVAVVDCFYSPFVIGLSFLFLGERMTGWQLVGAALIISAVLMVSRENRAGGIDRKKVAMGILLGCLAMLFTASGIVMIKPILGRVPFLWAALVRLTAGSLALGLIIALDGRRRELVRPLFDAANWPALFPGAFLGGFVSLLFWMGGMVLTFASVAAALNQLTTIFIFILAAVFLKERVTLRKVGAVILALIGVFLVTLR